MGSLVENRLVRWVLDIKRLTWLIVISALLIHPLGAAPYRQPISIEIADGNPLAWLMMTCLMLQSCLVAKKLMGLHREVTAAVFATNTVWMALIALTDPYSGLHSFAFVASIVSLVVLMSIWALDADRRDVFRLLTLPVIAAPVMILLLGFGAFQLWLIGSLLLATHITVKHLEWRGAGFKGTPKGPSEAQKLAERFLAGQGRR